MLAGIWVELPIHNMACSRREGWEVSGKTCPFSEARGSGGTPPGVGVMGSACLCLLSEPGHAMERMGRQMKIDQLLPGLIAAVSLSAGEPRAATWAVRDN